MSPFVVPVAVLIRLAISHVAFVLLHVAFYFWLRREGIVIRWGLSGIPAHVETVYFRELAAGRIPECSWFRWLRISRLSWGLSIPLFLVTYFAAAWLETRK